MWKKIIVIKLLIILILVNIFQYNQMREFKRTQEESMVLLLQAATDKNTSIILKDLGRDSQKEVEILYHEYSNNKKNLTYLLLVNKKQFDKGSYEELLTTINNNEFENYLLKIHTNKEVSDKDIKILQQYRKEYEQFKKDSINDLSLTKVNNLQSIVVSYSNLVKKANSLVSQ